MHDTESGRWSGIHNEIQSYVRSMEWYLNYESWRTIVCSEAMRTEVMRRRVRTLTIREAERLDAGRTRVEPAGPLPLGQPL